jgi:gliding motility-associated-like protein
VETKYRAAGVTTPPTFTIPAGTKSIAVYVSSETGLTGTTENDRADEDFITINAIIDVNGLTSSGFVNYAKNTFTNGTGTNVFGWKNVPIGDSIPDARKIGDADVKLNNVKFSIAGSTLTIDESAKGIHSSYYVEYLSPTSNSLSPLDPQIRALLHDASMGAASTDLSIPIPTGAEIVLISAKGTNSSASEGNLGGGIEEGFMNMRFGLDLHSGLLNGFVTVANGGTADRRSTYVISNKSATSNTTMLASANITGDYSSKRITAGGVGAYDAQIYVSGSNLIIKRDASYARDFDDAYVIEFYSRVGLGMATEFIDSDISFVKAGDITGTDVSKSFKIPAGTNFIYFNQTGNAINSNSEANENAMAAYGYIDLNAGTVSGYYYQQVGLNNADRRDDNYAFKNVPLTGLSTRGHSSKVGFTNGSYPYDIKFQLSADKSTLTVTNTAALVANTYQILLSADYYGARPDIAFSSTGISFIKGPSCNIVTANVNVCNPGSGNSNGGMPVSFYSGDPTTDATATLVYTGTFNQDIPMGECRTFSFNVDLSAFPNVNIPLTMIINDNGSFVTGGVGHAVGTTFTLDKLAEQNSTYKECYYDNNKSTATIAVNNCPTVSLDPDLSSGTANGRDFLNYFAAGSSTGAKITDSDAIASDPDGDNIVSATITLTNNQNGTAEYLQQIGVLPGGLTISGQNTNTIIISGSATPATYIAALQQISYMNTNATPNTTTRTITISLNDGKETGPASTASIVILTTPRVNVQGNGTSIADNRTTTTTTDGTNFGLVIPANGTVTRTFTVQNIGTGTINLTGTPRVTISGDPGFTITTQPSAATMASGTGLNFVVTFNPASHGLGNYTATVTILNSDANTDRATYTFAVSAAVNNLPVVTNATLTTAEDNALNFVPANFISNFTDPDGSGMQNIRVVTLPSNGNLQLNGAPVLAGQVIATADLGNLSFSPVANWNGTTSFQWNGYDGLSYAATNATMTIDVTAVNDAPTLTLPAGIAVTEDTPASLGGVSFADVDAGTGTVTATFSVPSGSFNTATVAGVTVTGSGGSITLEGTLTAINAYLAGNNLTYASTHTPPATTTISVTINDNGNTGAGGARTATGDIPLTITAVNDVPVAGNNNRTTNEDTQLSSSITATDADGDVLTYTLVTDVAHGTLTLNSDGTYTYMPDANYNGADSFVVTASDGNGGTINITVNITVLPVNDPPVAGNNNRTTNENTQLSSSITATDPDGDALTYTLVTDVTHGTLTLNSNGTYTYLPDANYNGADSFVVTANDGNGGTTNITVNITVVPVNDPPVAGNNNRTTNEDTQLSSSISATDPDGDALTYTLVTDVAHGTLTLNSDGTYTYLPDANYNGADSFVVTANDGNGGTTNITVNITVVPVNDPPVAGNNNRTTNEDTQLSSSISATDPDGDALTYTLVTDVTHGTLTLNSNGTYTYLPDANYNGADSFVVTANDGNGGTTNITVNITVLPVNDPPVAGNNNRTTNEDTQLSSSISATDPDGDALTYTLVTDVAHGTLTLNSDGTYTYLPDANYNGADSFVVTANDGNGGTTNITVNITVVPVNDPPVAGNNNRTTNEDTQLSSSISANDPDGDALTYTLVTDVAHGTLTLNSDGTYTYLPDANYNGADSFVVTANDGNGGTTNITVNITVVPVNDAPTGGPFIEEVEQDTDLASSVTANDIDGDVLTYSAGTTSPTHGTLTVNSNGTYTYSPAAGYTGNDSFTINVTDGTVTVPLTVNVTVRPVNHAPSGGTQLVFTDEDTELNASVISTDPDGDALTYTVTSTTTHGTLNLSSNGTFTYLPNKDFNGDDHFTVAVSDGHGGTAAIVVTIRVNPVNDAPVVTGGNDIETTTGKPGNGTIIATDPDGDPLTFEKGDDPTHGTVVVNPDGTYTYTPGEGYTGNDSFTIIVSDGQGGTTTVTVGVRVTPDVINIPKAVDDSITVLANTPVDINVLANDSAGTSTFNPQSVEIVDQPAHGTVVVNSDGSITYTPAPGYNGADAFTYRVQTMEGTFTNAATVNITTTLANVTVPTLFTPNGDGKNDVFMILGLGEYAETELIIINRWGNEVYRTKNYQNTWKGEGLNEGTYFYLLRVKRTAGSAWEVIKGYTTLVRNFNN